MSSSVRSYLGLVKKTLASLTSQTPVTAILGNESCDLDSAVSAIIYAHFLSLVSPNKDSVFVPILNVPKDQFRIKTEVVYTIRRYLFPTTSSCDLISDELFFRDTLDLTELREKNRLRLVLVDHNSLAADQKHLSDAVAGIVDHHAITDATLNVPDKTIEKVGSCTTLVAEKFFEQIDSGSTIEFPTEAGQMIRAAILEDTSGLKEGIQKTTPKDIQIIKRIEAEVLKINCDEDVVVSRLQCRNEISVAKQDLSDLRPEELFAKDTKISRVERAQMLLSTVPVSWSALRKKLEAEGTTLADVLPRVACSNNVDFILVYTVWSHSEGGRVMIFYSKDSQIRKSAVSAIQNNGDFDPKLMTLDLGQMGWDNMEAYVQTNQAITRKQVQPLLEKTFSL